jgi:hypothetical protein
MSLNDAISTLSMLIRVQQFANAIQRKRKDEQNQAESSSLFSRLSLD